MHVGQMIRRLKYVQQEFRDWLQSVKEFCPLSFSPKLYDWNLTFNRITKLGIDGDRIIQH